ncbi:MAG TPA: GSU2403 family nucleotidyltransferase fold protein [bacterium]|nr:GSU2403 family nucleotidyltransferase fold protein [bacterium]
MKFSYPFLTVLNDLNGITDELILVGGWVPTVYFEYLWKSPRDFFKTTDIDLAFPFLGVKQVGSIEKEINQLSSKKPYNRKHLNLGKEKPWQLVLNSNVEIDFLADAKEADKIRERILGKDVILNESKKYDFLLKEPLEIKCEGVLVRVPQPIRYIIHKIFVYLQNKKDRKKDLATAYYCLTRSPQKDALVLELSQLHSEEILKIIEAERKHFIESQSTPAIRDIQSTLITLGIREDSQDILEGLRVFFE